MFECAYLSSSSPIALLKSGCRIVPFCQAV
jgi:hypothetical protein